MSTKKPIQSGEHTPENLDKTLEFFSKAGILNPDENRRVKVTRPRRSVKDPYAVAKFVVEKLSRWFDDCVADEGLGPHEPVAGVTNTMEVIFCVELFWLNIINAEKIPATKEQIKKARDAAYTYYKNNS